MNPEHLDALPGVPAGLDRLPDTDPVVLVARVKPEARFGFWVRATLWSLGGLAVVITGWRVLFESWAGTLIVVAVVGYAGAAATKNIAWARFGDRPVLTIDDQRLRVLAPFNHFEVELSGISWVNAIGRDLLIAAKGAIHKHDRLSNARWATLNNVPALTVAKADLADYLVARGGGETRDAGSDQAD